MKLLLMITEYVNHLSKRHKVSILQGSDKNEKFWAIKSLPLS